METIKARKQGDSIIIELGRDLQISEGEEFFCFKDKFGIIYLVPKIEDYYADGVEGKFPPDEEEKSLMKNFSPRGSERGGRNLE